MSEDVGRFAASAGRRPAPAREVRALGGLERFRGKRVLEIGTGDGRLVWGYAHVARQVIAIDPDPEAIARARATALERGLANVRFEVAAAQGLDLGRRRCDLAVLSWAL